MRTRSPVHPSVHCLCAAALLLGAGCPDAVGGDTGTGDFGTDGFETDIGTGSSGDVSTTMPSTMSTTMAPTTTQSTTASTTMSTTMPGDSSSETGDTSDTAGTGCLATGTYTGTLIDRTDLYGHFPYLMLFYAPANPDEVGVETFQVDVAADGAITVSIAARSPGSGSGHEGIAALVGTMSETCDASVTATAPFTSDTGPFGEIDIELAGVLSDPEQGTAPFVSMTLQGGSIPNGPITYEVELSAE